MAHGDTLSTNSLCYEAIQRIYRNAVTRFLRTGLKQAFPEDWEERVKAPFKKEWQQITEAAQASLRAIDLSTPISDVFDYLGVNHFYSLVDTYYDQLFPMSRNEKDGLLQRVKAIRIVRDPLSHPGEEDLSIWDAISVVDSARRVLLVIDGAAAVSLQGILERLRGHDGPGRREPIPDTLPSRESIAVDFIGRQQELERLRAWVADPSSALWVLVGDGGKGKTALAYRFAELMKYQAPEPYGIILWLTAKRYKFVAGETCSVSPDFSDLPTAIEVMLRGYGEPDEDCAALEGMKDCLLVWLEAVPAIIVVDDVESLEGTGELAIQFLNQEVARTRSKVLMTSRRQPFGSAGLLPRLRDLPSTMAQVLFNLVLDSWASTIRPSRQKSLAKSSRQPTDRLCTLRTCLGCALPGIPYRKRFSFGGDGPVRPQENLR